MIDIKEKNDVIPLCPHCDETVSELWFREIVTMLGKRHIYFCSHCKKILGVSHRKGFWMG